MATAISYHQISLALVAVVAIGQFQQSVLANHQQQRYGQPAFATGERLARLVDFMRNGTADFDKAWTCKQECYNSGRCNSVNGTIDTCSADICQTTVGDCSNCLLDCKSDYIRRECGHNRMGISSEEMRQAFNDIKLARQCDGCNFEVMIQECQFEVFSVDFADAEIEINSMMANILPPPAPQPPQPPSYNNQWQQQQQPQQYAPDVNQWAPAPTNYNPWENQQQQQQQPTQYNSQRQSNQRYQNRYRGKRQTRYGGYNRSPPPPPANGYYETKTFELVEKTLATINKMLEEDSMPAEKYIMMELCRPGSDSQVEQVKAMMRQLGPMGKEGIKAMEADGEALAARLDGDVKFECRIKQCLSKKIQDRSEGECKRAATFLSSFFAFYYQEKNCRQHLFPTAPFVQQPVDMMSPPQIPPSFNQQMAPSRYNNQNRYN